MGLGFVTECEVTDVEQEFSISTTYCERPTIDSQ